MKKFSLIVCFVIMISLMIVPVYAQGDGTYYEQLSSDAFRQAYDLLEEGIAAMAPVIHFPKELEIRYMDMMEIARAVCLDHPEYFWFLEAWYYEYDTKDGRYLVDTFTPTYFLDGQRVSAGSQALSDALIAFHQKVDEIIKGIPVNYTTDYEIALYLHDYLADHVTYTLEGNHDSAYAALVHGRAACYGYSKAYQYLLSRAGVTSRIVVGDSVDEDGKMTGHAWNQVWIDEECFYSDVTWDDFETGTTHRYFLMSLDEITQDHRADERFALPECGHNIDVYERSAGKGLGKIYGDTSAKDAAAFFRLVRVVEKEAVFAGDIRFAVDMDTWLYNHCAELLLALGLSRNSEIYYYSFGDVNYLTLVDPYYRSVYSQAQSVTLNMMEVSLSGIGSQAMLIPEVAPFGAGVRTPVFTSDNEDVVTVSESGMITAVGIGSATVTVSSYDGKATAECLVTVDEGTPHLHTLRLIPAYDPTCTLDGNDPYYLCTGCFHRFEDAGALLEITDVSGFAKMATGHVDLSWQQRQNSNSHQQVCACGEPIAGTIANHTDTDRDNVCDLCTAEMYVTAPTEPKDPPTELKLFGFPIVYWIPVGVLLLGITIFAYFKGRD